MCHTARHSTQQALCKRFPVTLTREAVHNMHATQPVTKITFPLILRGYLQILYNHVTAGFLRKLNKIHWGTRGLCLHLKAPPCELHVTCGVWPLPAAGAAAAE